MAYILYNVIFIVLFSNVMIANVDCRAAFQTDTTSEHLQSEDVEDSPSADPLDSIFNEERFYESSSDSNTIPFEPKGEINSTAVEYKQNISSTVNTLLIKVNSTSKADSTLSNSNYLSISAAEELKVQPSFSVHEISTPSTLIFSTISSSYTVEINQNISSSATSSTSSTLKKSTVTTSTPPIRYLRTRFIEYSTPSPDDEITTLILNRPSVIIDDFQISSSIKISSSIYQFPLSVKTNASTSHAPVSSSSLISSSISSSTSPSNTTAPIDDRPHVYQVSTGLVSWENENTMTSTESLGSTSSNQITSQNTQPTTINHEHQHSTSTTNSDKTPIPDLDRKTTRFLYSGFILPIFSGIIGAIIIAVAIIMCRCCKRRRLKKVRYFGGKPKSDFVRLDRMNLLSDSSDYDDED